MYGLKLNLLLGVIRLCSQRMAPLTTNHQTDWCSALESQAVQSRFYTMVMID